MALRLYTSVIYSIQTTEQPELEPVSTAELFAHLKEDFYLEEVEDLLSLYITAAREHFELQSDGCVVLPTTFKQSVVEFDSVIKLMRGNVSEVLSVNYYDSDDTLTSLDGFASDITGTPSFVYMPSQVYPTLSTKRTRPITIEFVAGWPDVASVPKSVKLGIMLLAAHFYRTREAFTDTEHKEVPMGFQRVCDLHKTGLGII